MTTTHETINRSIPIELLDESKFNPRKRFAGIEDLAEDFARHGMLQPVLARPAGKRFEIVFGHRRYRAAKIAKLETVPAMVRELSDEEALEMQLVENSKREDVHPLEEADGYQRMHVVFKHPAEDIAAKVGKSVGYVYGRLKLCSLGKEAREAFLEGKVSPAAALALARIPVPKLQSEALETFTRENTREGQPTSGARAAEWIRDHYMLRLADAPFDRGDATLVPAAGACKDCPKRTGNQRELFADVKSPDLCTDPECFGAKRDAEWKRRSANAAGAGEEVLDAKEAKKAFPHGSHLSYNTPFVDLDAENYNDAKRRTYREILKKELPPLTLARDPEGGIHELARKADIAKALKSAGKKVPYDIEPRSSRSEPSASGQDAKFRREQIVRKAAQRAVLGAIATAAEKAQVTDAFMRVIAVGLVDDVWHDLLKQIVARRGIEPEQKEKREQPSVTLRKQAEDLAGGPLRGLVIELAIARYAMPGPYNGAAGGKHTAYDAACALFKVDAKKIEAGVRAEAKAAAAAAKKKPAKKTKGKK